MNQPYIKTYFAQLFVPWKILTFVLSSCLLTFIGTIANDPTWDLFVSFIMSALTFLTSTFFIITLYRFLVLKLYRREYPRLILSIFFYYISVSGSYDFYNLWIVGAWPESSLENFYISSMFYFSAGLFWGADFEDLRSSYIFSHRKGIYVITSIFIGASFLYFGIYN